MTDNKTKNAYLLEPKAPLIIRSGRPFDEQYGVDDARFPPPSTMAGALRAAYARTHDMPFNDKSKTELLNTYVQGPLPVKVDSDGEKLLMVPKPEDAHYYYDNQGNIEVLRLLPTELDKEKEGWDLEDSLLPLAYQEQEASDERRGKPAKGVQWWSYQHLLQWRAQQNLSYQKLSEQGWTPPEDDKRTHVSISPDTYSAEDGRLFQTSGLPMWQKTPSKESSERDTPFPDEHIAIWGAIQGERQGESKDNALNLGGERRLAHIRPDTYMPLASDNGQIDKILDNKQLSLTLLTPAIFNNGWLPCALNDEGRYIYQPDFIKDKSLELELVAAAVGRWHPNSGWDLVNRRPKPSQKMVPAGAVYWFKLIKGDEEQLKQLWLANISSSEQDRNDGFGLVLPHSASITTHSTSGDQ